MNSFFSIILFTYNAFTCCSLLFYYYSCLHWMVWFFSFCLFFFLLWQAASRLYCWITGLTFLKSCHSSLDWGGRVQETFNCQYLLYGTLLTQTLWQNMLQQPLSPSKVLSFISMACLPLCCMFSCIHKKGWCRMNSGEKKSYLIV